MDLKICILNEFRQTKGDKYITYILNLKKMLQMNLFTQ